MCFVAVLMAVTGPAFAEKRIALVIGNSNYEIGPLLNPQNDAELMAKTLETLGFEVIKRIDADQRTMKRAVRDFGKKLTEHGDQAVGLFYYAGHGVQISGTNYLVPIGAQIETEGDVDIESISADAVLSSMEYSGARLSFIILDACRNNPFRSFSRSTGGGLARINAPAGSLVAYATSPGTVAKDGKGRNSPYTFALAREMKVPGNTVEQMFRQVRNRVIERTNKTQIPWESSSLTGKDFYFAGPPVAPAASALEIEIADWKRAEALGDRFALQQFIDKHPDGPFRPLAEQQLAKLNAQPSEPEAYEADSEPEQQKLTINLGDDTVEKSKTKKQLQEAAENADDPDVEPLTEEEQELVLAWEGKFATDGEYELTYEIIRNPNRSWHFCRNGEKVTKTFTVENGEFDVWVTTNRGASGTLAGRVTRYGAFIGKLNPTAWRGETINLVGSVAGSPATGVVLPVSCTSRFTVTRLPPASG